MEAKVKKIYPGAQAMKYGKLWYIYDGSLLLGTGETESKAWKDALNAI